MKDKNVYITLEQIAKECTEELDFKLQDEFNYDYEKEKDNHHLLKRRVF